MSGAGERYDALMARLRAVSPEMDELGYQLDEVVGERLADIQDEVRAEYGGLERDRDFYRTTVRMLDAMTTAALAPSSDG